MDMSSFQNGIQHLPHLQAEMLQVSESSICLNRRIALCKFSQNFWARLDSLLPLSGCCHGQALVGTSAKVRPPLGSGGKSAFIPVPSSDVICFGFLLSAQLEMQNIS